MRRTTSSLSDIKSIQALIVPTAFVPTLWSGSRGHKVNTKNHEVIHTYDFSNFPTTNEFGGFLVNNQQNQREVIE